MGKTIKNCPSCGNSNGKDIKKRKVDGFTVHSCQRCGYKF